MPYSASELLSQAALRHGIRLEVLIAETGLWANPEVHRRLAKQAGGPAFFPNRRRYRAGQGEVRGQKIGTVVLDDNSYANIAIKHAIGVRRSELVGFEACHIWPLSCYDERHHTVVANLVLLPRALAGLTDHSPDVQAALQYRAWELYAWHPEGRPEPVKPDSYPTTWRAPMPFNDLATRAVARRIGTLQDGSTAVTPTERDYTRFDITLADGQVQRNLPKRVAMLALVRGLVGAGVLPEQIASALPTLGKRLFKSAPGHVNQEAFIAAVGAERHQARKTFDASRCFCADGELLHANGRTYALTNQWGGWTANDGAARHRLPPGRCDRNAEVLAHPVKGAARMVRRSRGGCHLTRARPLLQAVRRARLS